MSVNPGFGGQKFLAGSLDKVRRLRAQIQSRGLRVRIEVDGGVDLTNVRALTEAGADILVAGQAVFGNGDAERDARRLVEAAG
jgi:ribulose-phosphate 3-epimerase